VFQLHPYNSSIFSHICLSYDRKIEKGTENKEKNDNHMMG
jgi:hypothetical protein